MVLQLVGGEAMLPPFRPLDIPQPPPEAVTGAEVTRLREQVERQAWLIERQADRIDLLERLLAPIGPRGMARLRRSPWWLHMARRLRAKVAF